MNKIFMLLRNNKGSILTNLIAVGILGLSSIILVQYMSGVSSSLSEKTSSSDISFNIHVGLINNLRGLLIETKIDKNGELKPYNRWGVCSLINSPLKKSHGVDAVNLRVSSNLISGSTAEESFSIERWRHFFPQSEYTIVDDSLCKRVVDINFQSSPFSRCLKVVGEAGSSNVALYVVARIVLKKLSDYSEFNMAEVSLIDAKNVLFELQALIGADQTESSTSSGGSTATVGAKSKYMAVMWANEVAECNVQTANGFTSVQFSGSGVGRTSRKFVVNHSYFNESKYQCSEVSFGEMPANVMMLGKITGAGGDRSVEPDFVKNVRMSCRRNIYRCPGDFSLRSDGEPIYSPIEFNMGIFNDSGGDLLFNSLNFTILNKEGKEIDSSENKRLDTLSVDVISDGVGDFVSNREITPAKTLRAGNNFFSFNVGNEGSNQAPLANFCKAVCEDQSLYYPSLNINLLHPPDEGCDYLRAYNKETDQDKYRFRCHVCHSKMCYKMGMGAWGPVKDDEGVQGLTDEPLDGQIPECRIKSLEAKDYNLPSVSSGTGQCVAMKVERGMDDFKIFKINKEDVSKSAHYEYQNCNKKLPVLCFAFGHYFPAVSVTSHIADPQIIKATYAQAQETCYNLGREIISKHNLAEFFKGNWNNIAGRTNEEVVLAISNLGINDFSGSSQHFDYVNNATRGIFIVPSYNVSAISKRLKADGSYLKKFFNEGHKKIWVAMEKDGGGQMIGSIPLASVASSPHAIFNRKELPSRSILLRDISSNISNSFSGEGTLLVHNIRYKGVYPVSRTGTRRALCKKENGSFVLSGPTTLSGAKSTCRGLGAYFIPPLSSMEYVKALALLARNDELYPFPTPGDFSDPEPSEGEEPEERSYLESLVLPQNEAWIALSKAEGAEEKDLTRASHWRLNKLAHFPDSNSIFKREVIPSSIRIRVSKNLRDDTRDKYYKSLKPNKTFKAKFNFFKFLFPKAFAFGNCGITNSCGWTSSPSPSSPSPRSSSPPIKYKSVYAGVIDYKGKPIVKHRGKPITILKSHLYRNLPFKKVCVVKDSNGQVKDLFTVSINKGCSSLCGLRCRADDTSLVARPVNDSNLKHYFKSIKFMSLWLKKIRSGEYVINSRKLKHVLYGTPL